MNLACQAGSFAEVLLEVLRTAEARQNSRSITSGRITFMLAAINSGSG